jgi:hypothetical protein
MAQTATYSRTRSSGASGRHLRIYRPIPTEESRVVVLRPSSTAMATATRGLSGRRRLSADRLDASVYRRRRLLAAGLFLLAIAAVLVLAQLIQAGIGGGPLTTTGAAAGSAPMIPAGTRDYVVQPGDTLWSIAERVDPNGDERPLVDALDRQVGGTVLYPGERIPIPAHW